MQTRLVTITVLLVSCAFSSLGNVQRAPPVDRDTIKGSWEALAEDYERVFRLELGDGLGWLSIGVQFIDPMIFTLTKTRWDKSGVELYFKGVGSSSKGAGGPDDLTPYTALLRLKGVAWKDANTSGGLLTGVFVLCPERKNPSRWKVRFLKDTAFPDFKTLLQLSERAKQAIEQQKQNPK